MFFTLDVLETEGLAAVAAANELTSAAILIPVITGIVQALKLIGLKDKFAPLASIGLGAGLALLLRGELQTFTHAIYLGIIYGLSASGLYSGLVHSLNAGRGQAPQSTSETKSATRSAAPDSGASIQKMEEKSVKIETKGE